MPPNRLPPSTQPRIGVGVTVPTPSPDSTKTPVSTPGGSRMKQPGAMNLRTSQGASAPRRSNGALPLDVQRLVANLLQQFETHQLDMCFKEYTRDSKKSAASTSTKGLLDLLKEESGLARGVRAS